MSRTGKIAKLPEKLQEELNHQLERGVPGRVLIAWLNDHPVVQAILHEFFEGAPVNEQNLSAWRRGGFADWQTRRQFFDQVREVASGTGDFEKITAHMAEHAARLLSAHYAIALSELPVPDAAATDPYASLSRLKPLASVTRSIVALRRADHCAARLKMEGSAPSPPADSPRVVSETSRRPESNLITPDQPVPMASERVNQPKSSQIKVAQIQSNPATATERKAVISRSPYSTEKPPASPFPPRLILTFPPSHHFLVAPPVSTMVA